MLGYFRIRRAIPNPINYVTISSAMMGKRRLVLRLGALMLVILFANCFISCAQLPYKGLKDIVEDDINLAQQRGFHPNSHVMPKRRTFDLSVSSSQLSGSMEAAVLLEFRKGVTQDPFNILSDWNDTNISNYCNWTGVKCNDLIGQVSALNLSGYDLKGSISPSLDGLAFLSSLDLSDNWFEGTIQASIANFSSLTLLYLYGNQLTGEIPTEIGFLSQLQDLQIDSNILTGSIPASLGNCSALVHIGLGLNQLTGEVPMEIFFLSQVSWIALEENDLTGSIPASLGNCSSLVIMGLGRNQLTGEVPIEIGLLSHLKWISLAGNHLTGFIPTSFLNCSSLAYMDLSNNQFTGEVPREIGLLSKLRFISLWGNNLAGSIPASVGNCSPLATIALSSNQFTGNIPTTLGNLFYLTYLRIGDNKLQGPIPSSIGQLANLEGLLLPNNGLKGIPTELFNCTLLSELDLSNNKFSNSIPVELRNLRNLNILYLQSNNFTGSILSAFGQESARLLELNLSYNGFTGAIDRYNFAPLRNLQQGLDLSHNFFSGPLPGGIGELKTIQNIDLSFNSFSGVILGEFSQCIELDSLDLSSNNLDGQIPQSLPASHLTYFNVSYNNLSGSVLDQFDNFGDGSFLGNPNLCGPMLSNKCSPQGHAANLTHRALLEDWISSPAVGMGVAIGFILVSGFLLPWAYVSGKARKCKRLVRRRPMPYGLFEDRQ